MKNLKSSNLLQKANQEYDIVMEELNRPQEDLVMIAACELVKNAISDFLEAFLEEEGIKTTQDDILQMKQKCAAINPQFEQLDYGPIAYLGEEESVLYTSELGSKKLGLYAGTLRETKDLVLTLLQEKESMLLMKGGKGRNKRAPETLG
ncbi:MAG: hypothetical protein KI790_05540 [Cyclobacteriaceae bacterium]|nr:hypothetical protein [Cyclobacteriaceae bacterium HetDA_MAG_MS6]